MKDKNKHIKSGTNSLCRARSSTNDDLEDSTLKRISKLPGSRFLNSRVWEWELGTLPLAPFDDRCVSNEAYAHNVRLTKYECLFTNINN